MAVAAVRLAEGDSCNMGRHGGRGATGRGGRGVGGGLGHGLGLELE
jgi:hypothetical protein